MGGDNKVEQAIAQLSKVLGVELTDEQEKQVRQLIETAMSDTAVEMTRNSSEVIKLYCSADQDLAHKLNQEMELAKTALIANLTSLR